MRKGALKLPLTVQLVPELFRAGWGFSIDGSIPQPVSAEDSEECLSNTWYLLCGSPLDCDSSGGKASATGLKDALCFPQAVLPT